MKSLAVALADWSGRNRGGYLISLQRRSLRGDISGAFVSLRTITGPDAEFAAAIRRASHESPDILLITGPQTELPLHEAILASTGGRLVIVAVVAPTTVDALRVLVGQSGLDRARICGAPWRRRSVPLSAIEACGIRRRPEC